METMTKEEYLKKLKTKIKRAKITRISFVTEHDMPSKVKDLDIALVEVGNRKWLDIIIKQVEVCHQTYNVNHHFLYQPLGEYGACIKACKYIPDDRYSLDYLMNTHGSYDMWNSHFRESLWSVAKALRNTHFSEFDKLV